MEIMLKSTNRIVELASKDAGAGKPIKARIWEGETDSGIPVICVVASIAAPEGQDQTQFRAELEENAAPTDLAIKAFPLRMLV